MAQGSSSSTAVCEALHGDGVRSPARRRRGVRRRRAAPCLGALRGGGELCAGARRIGEDEDGNVRSGESFTPSSIYLRRESGSFGINRATIYMAHGRNRRTIGCARITLGRTLPSLQGSRRTPVRSASTGLHHRLHHEPPSSTPVYENIFPN